MQFLFYFVSSDVNREFVERIKNIRRERNSVTGKLRTSVIQSMFTKPGFETCEHRLHFSGFPFFLPLSSFGCLWVFVPCVSV